MIEVLNAFWQRERSCHCKRSEIVFLKVLPREYSVLEMAVKRKWYGLLQPDIGVASAGLRVKEMGKGCLILLSMLDASLLSLGAAKKV